MDPIGIAIRVADGLSPYLRANLQWQRYRSRDLTLRVVELLVAKGDVAVDIGASRGLFTGALLRMVGRHGHVHAFEPNPVALDSLERFPRRHLTVHPVGLSDHGGEAVLKIPVVGGRPRPGLAAITPPRSRRSVPYQAVAIRVERLDDALPQGTNVSFVKCDVEGNELAVLRGAQQTLAMSRPTLVIEIEQRHHDGGIDEVFDFVTTRGYTGLAIQRATLLALEEFRPELHQPRAAVQGLAEVPTAEYVSNFLFVPTERPLPSTLSRLVVRK